MSMITVYVEGISEKKNVITIITILSTISTIVLMSYP